VAAGAGAGHGPQTALVASSGAALRSVPGNRLARPELLLHCSSSDFKRLDFKVVVVRREPSLIGNALERSA